MFIFGYRSDILLGDHSPIAHKDEPLELEPLAQIAYDFLDRRMVDTIARPNVVCDRPARDHDNSHNNLHILRLAVATVTVLSEVGWTFAFKVGAGDVIENQFGLEAEEVSQSVVKSHFDPIFGSVKLVKCPVPRFELSRVDADAATLVPLRDKSSALAIANEVGLKPAGQPVLTRRGDQSVRDEDKGAVGKRDTSGPSKVFVKNSPKAQLIEQSTQDEDWSPVGRIAEVGVSAIGFRIAPEESSQSGKQFDEKVLASEISDNSLLDLTPFAVGFDNAHVFVDGPAGRADLDGSGVHASHCHDDLWHNQGEYRENPP
jgi:hypothetical protein